MGIEILATSRFARKSDMSGKSFPSPIPAPIHKATHRVRYFPQMPSFLSFSAIIMSYEIYQTNLITLDNNMVQ